MFDGASGMRILTILVLAVTVLTVGTVRASRQQVNFTRTNLQVLPKDVPVREMVNLMRSFALGLGVRCQHCHVGEGDDLSQFDFASDAKPTKLLARNMMRMTTEIDARVSSLVKSGTGPRVTCFTCHRGALKPETVVPEPGRSGGAGR
jgi:hypothetical protein